MNIQDEVLFELSATDLQEFMKMSSFYKKLGFFGLMTGFIIFFISTLSFIFSLIGGAYFEKIHYFTSIPYFMYLMVIVISGLFFLASIKLNRVGYDLEKAIKTNNQESFDDAIEVLNKYFESYGLIMIALSILFIIIIIKSLNNPSNEYYQSF